MLNFFDVFRQGKSLAHADTWRNSKAATDALCGVLVGIVTLAGFFGYSIPADPDKLQALAGGIVAAYGIASGLLHIAASNDLGLPSKASDGNSRIDNETEIINRIQRDVNP